MEENVPIGQAVQLVAPADDWKYPAEQDVHEDTPATYAPIHMRLTV